MTVKKTRKLAAEPYSDSEIAQLLFWLHSQPKQRAHNATVVLSLGIGAGLTSKEIGDVRHVFVEDLRPDLHTEALVVNLMDATRCVWSFGPWVRLIAPLIDRTRGLDHVLEIKKSDRRGNAVRRFLRTCSAPGVELSFRRMRATFVREQLKHSAPVEVAFYIGEATHDQFEAFHNEGFQAT